jgi:carbon monoxide dehydrogenase subunit G
MINVEVSVMINRPLAEVFAVLSNLENNMRWRSGMIAAEKTSTGPINVGTTYRIINSIFGRRIEGEAVVSEYNLNQKYATINKSGLPIETKRTFEPVNGGTKVTFAVKAELSGFFNIAKPVLEMIGKRRLESDAVKAKELIEAGIL